jgi:sec-independent protein translocase protein TatC
MAEEREEEGLQMSFLDHLDELRQRLIYSVIAIAVSFAICFYFSDEIFKFLQVPVKKELHRARLEQQKKVVGSFKLDQLPETDRMIYTFAQDISVEGMKVSLGTTIPIKVVRKEGKSVALLAATWVVGKTIIPAETPLEKILNSGQGMLAFDENEQLIITKVGGAFTLFMQIGLYAGLALAIPFLLYQIWAFISPGLYRHEKKYAIPIVAMSTIFFIGGATFGYTIAFPAACHYLLGLQTELFRSLLTADDYFDLIIMVMLGLGIVFQIPTIAFLLGRIGLVTPGLLWKAWRYAVIAIAILSALLTPTTDYLNMLIFAAPMLGLYFLSIGIVWLFGKPRRSDAEIRELAHSE